MLQMGGSIDPARNAAVIEDAIREARGSGAAMLFTPEMSNLLDRDRTRAARHVTAQADDLVLRCARAAARREHLWVVLGSIAVRADGGERWANRSIVLDDEGEVRAQYDKLHLFDVDLPDGERYRESAAYAAGERAAVVDTPAGRLGLSICYDLRFPALYAALSAAGTTVISIPAAFTQPTGAAHWHVLMRARAVENAAFVVAAAHTGRHEDGRETFGHSLVVGPWGEVLLDMGEEPGLGFCDLDLTQVERVRERIPVIAHRRHIHPLP